MSETGGQIVFSKRGFERKNAREILGVRISITTYEDLAARVLNWAEKKESRSVAFANVHVLMEAYDDIALRTRLNALDVINPDGMPLVWALRALGERKAQRVYGPDAMEVLLQRAEAAELPVGFFGSTEHTLKSLIDRTRYRYPALRIAFAMSPPFRPLTDSEDREVIKQISESDVRLLFVGTGCPKQERWIADHRGRIPSVMLAVGAAFDFIAGTKSQAPRWMMRLGLEWFFRLASEPRRLAGRYCRHNPRFVLLMVMDFICSTFQKTTSGECE